MNKIEPGVLVYDTFCGVEDGTGIVLEVRRDVEIPPSVSILWSNGVISNTWCDDIEILCNASQDVVELKSKES